MRTFVGGLAIGWLVGLAIAPAKGDETRRRLRSEAEEWKRRAREQAERLKDGFQEAFNEVRNISRDMPELQSSRRATRGQRPSEDGNNQQWEAHGSPLSLLNHASREQLMNIKGIGPVLATRIMEGRPYESEDQVLENKDLPPSVFELAKAEWSRRKAG